MEFPTEVNGAPQPQPEADAPAGRDAHRPDVLILGAGPTGLGVGLGVALHSASQKVLLVERNSTTGGLGGSFAWKGHSIDYGPHRLSPNLRTVRALVDELLGPDCLIKRSQHGVQFAGRLYQFPPRLVNLLHPAPHYHLLAFAGSFLAAKAQWIVRRFRSDTFETTVVRKFGRRFYRRSRCPDGRQGLDRSGHHRSLLRPRAVCPDPAHADPQEDPAPQARVEPLHVFLSPARLSEAVGQHERPAPPRRARNPTEQSADRSGSERQPRGQGPPSHARRRSRRRTRPTSRWWPPFP